MKEVNIEVFTDKMEVGVWDWIPFEGQLWVIEEGKVGISYHLRESYL